MRQFKHFLQRSGNIFCVVQFIRKEIWIRVLDYRKIKPAKFLQNTSHTEILNSAGETKIVVIILQTQNYAWKNCLPESKAKRITLNSVNNAR
jgi:hypothetical protein